MPRFYETTLSITNLHNLSISTHVNRSRINEHTLVNGAELWNSMGKVCKDSRTSLKYTNKVIVPEKLSPN